MPIGRFLYHSPDGPPLLKKSISSLALRRLISELGALKGAHFQKAYQLDHGTLVMRFAQRREVLEKLSATSAVASSVLSATQGPDPFSDELLPEADGPGSAYCKVFLYFRMGNFLYATPRLDLEMPKDPSPFAMKLRSALGNRRLDDVYQVAMDRLLVLEFERDRSDGTPLKLYLELFGDGNAVLVRGDIIEAPFTSRTWASRTVKRGEPFQPPPPGPDPTGLTALDIRAMLAATNEDLVHFLIRRCGLPPVHAEEVCFRLGMDRKVQPSTLGPEAGELMASAIGGLLDELSKGTGAFVHFNDGAPELIEPVMLRSFLGRGGNGNLVGPIEAPLAKGTSVVHEPSISSAIERYIAGAAPNGPPVDRSREKEMERLRKQLEEQRSTKAASLLASDRFKELGDALYLLYSELSTLIETFVPEGYQADPASFPMVVGHTPAPDGSRGKVRVRVPVHGTDMEFELDLSSDVIGNANAIYELSKKEKRRAEGLDQGINATQEKLSALVEAANEEEDGDLPTGMVGKQKGRRLRSFWFESFRWCFTTDNILLLAGRDARSNEKLVKKYMRETDLYAHADISGAASVVIRAEKDMEVPETSKEEGCHLSVLQSKAWHSKVGSAGAYWVQSHQVSRTPQSGEFVAKGSFIIRGRKNLMVKLPLVGAIGTVYIEGVPKAMFGPERSVASRCSGSYYRLTPGRTEKNDAAKVISASLGCELDQVLSVLPAGDMDIVRVERHSEG